MPTDDAKTLPRTPLEDAKWARSTVVLYDRQIAFLQQFSQEIQKRTGHTVSGPEIVRALVDALTWSGLDETLIAAMYGSSSDETEVEVTSPMSAVPSSADLLRDRLVEILRDLR